MEGSRACWGVEGKGLSEFFVDAFVAAFHDGEALGFGVRDGKRFGQFGSIDLGYEFTDGIFAEVADLQRSTVHRAHQFKTLRTDAAGFPGVSSDVFVDGHSGRGVKIRLSPRIARMGQMARIKKGRKGNWRELEFKIGFGLVTHFGKAVRAVRGVEVGFRGGGQH